MDNKLYRQNVACIIVDEDYPNTNNIFIGKRIDMKNVWQFPQGGIDEGESAKEALIRELGEEVGLKSENIEIVASCPMWFQYNFPNFRWGNYIGQQQKYFLIKTDKKYIDIHMKNAEFSLYEFVEISDGLKKVSKLKKIIYDRVVNYFKKNNYL
jgi:putative (di)nucleoside polyphosphate hydrolase